VIELDDAVKAQLKLSLEVLSSTLTFLASPHMADQVRRYCQDREFYEAVRKVVSSVQALELSCYGAAKTEMVRRFISEVRRCQDMDCVRRVVGEYEAILGPGPSVKE